MIQELEDFYTLLREQRNTQQELLDLSYEKKQTIISNNTQRLNEIVQQEMKLLSTINSVEKRRAKALPKLSKNMNVPENSITLNTIIEHTAGEIRKRFILLKKEMNALLKTQVEINDLNQELLKTHIDYTNTMLDLIVGAEDPLNNLYGGDGKAPEKAARKNAGLFDKQI